MNFVALKMLVGDRAKYLGILMGLTFASLLITQQSAIFVGLMSRTFGFLTDTALPDIWVMDQKVQFIDDIKPLQDTELYRVRSVEGVTFSDLSESCLIRPSRAETNSHIENNSVTPGMILKFCNSRCSIANAC